MTDTIAKLEQLQIIAGFPSEFAIDEQTTLRQIVPDDAEALATIVSNNPDTRRYVTWAHQINGPETVVPVLQSRSDERMTGRYAVQSSGVILGYAGVFPGESPIEYGFGYLLDAQARGNGYATKAVSALIGATIERTEKADLYLEIAVYNEPSKAIARRLGFKPAEIVHGPILDLIERRYRKHIGVTND
jgi:RimJ/RimL family protein N-acetyltransferase